MTRYISEFTFLRSKRAYRAERELKLRFAQVKVGKAELMFALCAKFKVNFRLAEISKLLK